jgi:hypothetical protein
MRRSFPSVYENVVTQLCQQTHKIKFQGTTRVRELEYDVISRIILRAAQRATAAQPPESANTRNAK